LCIPRTEREIFITYSPASCDFVMVDQRAFLCRTILHQLGAVTLESHPHNFGLEAVAPPYLQTNWHPSGLSTSHSEGMLKTSVF